jgi:hypothetical protein
LINAIRTELVVQEENKLENKSYYNNYISRGFSVNNSPKSEPVSYSYLQDWKFCPYILNIYSALICVLKKKEYNSSNKKYKQNHKMYHKPTFSRM